MATPRGFTQVEDDILQFPDPQPAAAPPPRSAVSSAIDAQAVRMMQLALGALSQRAVVALASLFMLATVGAAFYIWLLIINEPTQLQIAAASIFSGFILLINYLNLRRK